MCVYSTKRGLSFARNTCPIAVRVGSCPTRHQTWSGLGNRCDRSHSRSTDVLTGAQANILAGFTVRGLLRAVAGNVAGLTTLVASLSGRVQGTAIGSRAVARDVTELAASIALHGLSLAITGKVIRSTTLIARSRARATNKSTPAASKSSITTTARTNWAATAHVDTSGVRASASQVAWLTAVVAATTSGTATAQTKCWAVGLDMAKTLAVVALLGLGGARKRAAVGLVAGLLAVVAKTFGRRADLSIVAYIAALVARATGERRHCGGFALSSNITFSN